MAFTQLEDSRFALADEAKLPIGANMKLHLIAVVPGVRRGEDVQDRWSLKAADSLKLVNDDSLFCLQLVDVTEMLIVTATALSEVRTAGRNAYGGWGEHLKEFGAGPALMFVSQADADLFIRKGKRDENHTARVIAAKALTTIRHSGKRQLNFVSHPSSLLTRVSGEEFLDRGREMLQIIHRGFAHVPDAERFIFQSAIAVRHRNSLLG